MWNPWLTPGYLQTAPSATHCNRCQPHTRRAEEEGVVYALLDACLDPGSPKRLLVHDTVVAERVKLHHMDVRGRETCVGGVQQGCEARVCRNTPVHAYSTRLPVRVCAPASTGRDARKRFRIAARGRGGLF